MHTKEIEIKGVNHNLPVPVWNYVKRLISRFERYKKDAENYQIEINRLKNELLNIKNQGE